MCRHACDKPKMKKRIRELEDDLAMERLEHRADVEALRSKIDILKDQRNVLIVTLREFSERTKRADIEKAIELINRD